MKFIKAAVIWLMAVAATSAVLVGIPLLLLSAGNSVSIPRSIESIIDLNDRAVLGLLVAVAWVSWAWIAVAILREFVATLAGRATNDARGAGLSQMVARLLIGGLFRLGATSTAVVGLVSPLAGAGGLVVSASMVDAQEQDPEIQEYMDALADEANQIPDDGDNEPPVVDDDIGKSLPSDGGAVVGVSPLTDSVPYEVVEDDTLWGISERFLGDGFRNNEIFERSEGFVQPGANDRVLVDRELINPGMVLLLPADATNVPTVDEAKVHSVYGLADSLATATTDADDSRFEVDQNVDEDEAEVVDLRLVEETGASSDFVIDSVERPGATSDVESQEVPVIEGLDERVVVDAELGGESAATSWIVASGAGLGLASLLVKVLRDRRKRTVGDTVVGETLASPSRDGSSHEARLVAGADTAKLAWFDDAMMSLASTEGPQPLLATVANNSCEVMFDSIIGKAREPWEHVEIRDGLDSLRVSRDTEFERVFEPNPVPLMVEVTDELWLNFEAAGTVAISGDNDVAAGLLRALLLQVEYSPQTRDGQISITPAAAQMLGHESVTKEPDEIVASYSQWASDTVENLVEASVGSCFNLRSAGHDSFVPVLVVCSSQDEALSLLWEQSLCSAQSPVVFAVLGEVEGMYPLVLSSDGEVAVGHDRLLGRSSYVSAEGWELASELMEQANTTVAVSSSTEAVSGVGVVLDLRDRRDEEPNESALVDAAVAKSEGSFGLQYADASPEEPIEDEEPDGAADDDADGNLIDSEGEFGVSEDEEVEIDLCDVEPPGKSAWNDSRYARIRLMGPVSVEGLEKDLSEQQLSLLTFVTVFGAVKTERVVEALWASRSENVDLKQLASKCRTSLTRLRGAAGSRIVPAASTDGKYRTEWVTTDLEEFTCRLQAAASTSVPEERFSILLTALDLVSGELFLTESDKWWSWITTHDFRFYLEPSEAVVDAACEAADLGLELGRYGEADLACSQGLAAVPFCTRLATRLVKIKVVQGSADAAEAFVDIWESRFDDVDDAPPEPREMLETAIAGAA